MRACAREIVEALQIDMENTPKGKRRVVGYDAEDESYELSQQDQLTTTLFFPLIDHAIYLLKDRFEQMHR